MRERFLDQEIQVVMKSDYRKLYLYGNPAYISNPWMQIGLPGMFYTHGQEFAKKVDGPVQRGSRMVVKRPLKVVVLGIFQLYVKSTKLAHMYYEQVRRPTEETTDRVYHKGAIYQMVKR